MNRNRGKTKRYIIIGLIIILGLFLIFNKCEPRPVYKGEVDKEMIKLDIKNDNLKEEIIIKENELIKKRVIEDSIIEINNIIYKRYKDVVEETPDISRSLKDTLIDGLIEEIIIKDTIIDILDNIITKKEMIIHNLEIKEGNFKDMIVERDKELVKVDKKIRRKNIIIGITSAISTTLITILLIDKGEE